MALYPPTILYPNGGESLATPTVTVRWTPPAVADTDGRSVWFELFYADDYAPGSPSDWVAIATLPSTATAFAWRVPAGVSSDRVRFAVRTRNSKGQRSAYSVSAGDVSINRAILPVPKIVSPVAGGRYDAAIRVVVAPERLPDRAYYQFFYSSEAAGIPLTSIGRDLPATSLPFAWSTAELEGASDYTFYAAAVDRNGNVSEMSEVPNITIAHEGYFLIDTLPPTAAVKIEGGSQFTRSRDISVSVYAHDDATGVHAMKIGDTAPHSSRQVAAVKLTGEDGVKNVTALVQDFGGNRNRGRRVGVHRQLADAMYLIDSEVVDFHVSTSAGRTRLYAVTDGDSRALYEISGDDALGFPRRVRTLDDEPVCVAAYLAEPCVSVVDAARVGSVLKPSTSGWVEAVAFEAADEFAVDMEAFGDHLYLGMNDGRLLRYDGAIVEEVDIDADDLADAGLTGRPVRRLFASADSLFVSFENSTALVVFDGTNARVVET